MENFGFGKWIVWLVISLLFRLFSVNVIAQPGFLSIDCGATANVTDENNIAWVTDDNYIDVGKKAYTGNTSQAYGNHMQNLRYFPQPLSKSCYQLPVIPSVPYLLRLWFGIGHYIGFVAVPKFAFSIETRDMLAVRNLSVNDSVFAERILVTAGRVLYVCLIRTSDIDNPFINAIELRTLQIGMYPHAKPGTMLKAYGRYDVGGNMSIRYPQDKFDRIWQPDTSLLFYGGDQLVLKLNLQKQISINNTVNLPPSIVMQTAWVTSNNASLTIGGLGTGGTRSLLVLYFAEVEILNMSETRSFNVFVNSEQESVERRLTIVRNYSASEVQLPVSSTNNSFVIASDPKSSYGPILNAFENFVIINTDRPTYMEDINALNAIKTFFDIKSWIADPCYVKEWDGIGCDKISTVIRISEINLSGMNLTGLVPQNIGQLTALINVSLDNNQLMGPLPNFSGLTMLERLHLQNNNLSGSLPEWLSKLKNLKELFIENNNFTGVIPVQLLDKPSLKLERSGNQYLCIRMHKGKCIQSNTRKTKVSFVLGTAISGAVIMALVLIVVIVVHLKKLTKRNRLSKDKSMTTVPNPTMSSAFSLKEMVKATQKFGQKIGQGGFGSVFFGKLPGGKDIAVKVLSLSSKQGIHEFQNEIDLLSRVHHKNLVALLGYCNQSKELMLIYEHMSGGSLRDHLYGPKARIFELNWKTRLKIALDAAHGLEYLHVGCTPKIIHRDIKTANILLDSNLNGKVADFGLSRMTSDGEATHVTTTVKGTAGYLDPEYFRTQMLTEKSDVYSFGVVLLEIICGRPPINANLPEEELNLIQWVTPYVETQSAGEIEEIIDRRLGENYDMKSITGIAKLAMKCVGAKPSTRPSASEVVVEIKEAIMHENGNNAPIRNSEVIGIECGDLQAGPVCSRVDAMEWGDNSSNLPQVGR